MGFFNAIWSSTLHAPPFTHTPGFLQVSQLTVIESRMAACKIAPVFGCASGFTHVFVYVTCCASVFATDLSGIISLPIYDRHAVLAIKSAMDNFQSQRNKVVFPLVLEHGAAPSLPPFLPVS